MVTPSIFSQRKGSLINYDFSNIATGRGITKLYGGQLSGQNILSDIPFYSTYPVKNVFGTATVGGWTLSQDLDYDMEFEKPITIRGETIVNVTGGCASLEGPAITYAEYIVVTLYKVVGGVETSIGTAQTTHNGPKSVAAANSIPRAISIDVPNTKFKKGETLRLNIKQYGGQYAGSDSPVIGLGQSPMDRNDDGTIQGDARIKATIEDADPTQLIVYLPIKILD